MNTIKKALFILLLVSTIISCKNENSKLTDAEIKGEVLYNTYCASCHIAPSIQDLTKSMWMQRVLPEMGVRMGITSDNYIPLEPFMEKQIATIKAAGIVPENPMLSHQNWVLLKSYIISLAPDSLATSKIIIKSNELTQFTPKPISLDTIDGTFITYFQYDSTNKRLLSGDISGNLFAYNFKTAKNSLLNTYGSAITDYIEKDNSQYVTAIGYLNPSEVASGKVIMTHDTINNISELHRPVNTVVADLNGNGNNELVISEFGYLTGKLSLYEINGTKYQKKLLAQQPGAIRTLTKDMNNDGKEDLITLFAQGDESITIFYQEDNLSFRADKVIRFSPIYGLSWFELIDYNGDGYDDIITINGDNADNTYMHKPYHGLRIHINDGNNNFEEKYFYSLNGATRLVANDFDQDGDVDFGIISTFPDYDNTPEFSFVYLENIDSNTFDFATKTFKDSKLGRWFLMDSGDVDEDGDEDIILSSFTYVFSPVPKELTKLWNEKGADVMVLENKLIE